MKELFGIPIDTLTLVLAIMLAALVGGIALLAVRNRVLVKLGVRNVSRRRARSALIVVGLMLGTTIIASALATGDTMSHTIRSTAVQAPLQRQTEPSVSLYATDPSHMQGFTPISDVAGGEVKLADLRPGQIYLN